MHPYHSFETERLLLKPTVEEDAAMIFELFNTPKWIENIGNRHISSLEEARAHIKNKMLPQLQRLGFSNYTIVLKDGGDKLGICGLYQREGLQEIDLGFALLPHYEGKGYAFEAAAELKRAGIQVFGLHALQAITIQTNKASQALLKKLGFTLKGEVRLPTSAERLLLFEYRP